MMVENPYSDLSYWYVYIDVAYWYTYLVLSSNAGGSWFDVLEPGPSDAWRSVLKKGPSSCGRSAEEHEALAQELSPVAFDELGAQNLTSVEVRDRWPRQNWRCPYCSYTAIRYASFEHYIAGDW